MLEKIDAFILYLATEKGLSDHYQILVRMSLETFAAWLHENHQIKDPSQVSLEHLTAYLAVRQTTLATGSLRIAIIALQIFFRFLKARGHLKTDVSEDLSAPKLEQHLPETMNEVQVDHLLANISLHRMLGKRDAAILELLYASGLRVSELTQARLENLNLEDRIIRVTGKGDKMRLIPVGGRARESIQRYLEEERPQLVNEKTSSHVFLSIRGQALTTKRIWQICKERAREAGLRINLYPHLFRHTFATHLLGNGADLRVIQELLGHADISTTQIYTHVDNRQLRETHRKFHPRG